jgi:CRP/FNR family transcriptional regulator
MKLDPSTFVADPELLLALGEHATKISCSGDRVLFHQGERPQGLYILEMGEASITMTSPKGKEIMSVEASAGSLLGLPGLISDEPYTLTVVAHEGARLCFVPRDEFKHMMQGDPRLALKILQVLAAEVRSARSALANR